MPYFILWILWIFLPALSASACRSKGAAALLYAYAVAVAIVAVALQVHNAIDLSMCNGDFFKGILCPPEITASLAYATASRAYAIYATGLVLAVTLAVPAAIAAAVIELFARKTK